MRDKLNNGKTTHVFGGRIEAMYIARGGAMLAWSFNADGEANPELVAGVEKRKSWQINGGVARPFQERRTETM